jgi:lysine decarboxylase
MSILEGLEELLIEDLTRLHTPGHKGKDYLPNILREDIQRIDFTEIPGSDNLHNAREMILQSEERSAKVFKALGTYYLINGTTVGIQAMILSTCNPGDKIIVPRNCHRSVWSALILGDITPIYISPQTHPHTGIGLSISPEEVQSKLKQHPDIKAAIITYPTYYGSCSDIEKISKILHNENKLLLVDEAHGAHFAIHNKLPITALEAGADITVQSTHKLLSSFTQSSMLHVGSNNISIERLEMFLTMLQSSSPSYPLMASLDFATKHAKEEGYKRWDNILKWTISAYNEIKDRTSMVPLGMDIIGKHGVADFDLSKLLINVSNIGLRGTEVDKILREQYGIQVELSDYNYILAMAGIGTEQEDIERFTKAIIKINNLYSIHKKPPTIKINTIKEKVVLTPREAVYSKAQDVLLKDSQGRISKEFIIPYPPGIPIVLPGEEITREIINIIAEIKQWGGQIIGPKDPKLNKISVIKM